MILQILSFPFIAIVKLYQLVISPWLSPSCRYIPTCSQYAIEALKKYARQSKSLGFDGMGCIHPRQLKDIHEGFAPDQVEIEKRNAERDKVEAGKNYALVVSTTGGLWRYLIGDTIQFISLNPYKIKITGRLKHYMNAFGEEVIVDNSDKAIALACEKTGAIVNDYTAAPVYFSDSSNGAHEWLIEFDKAPDDLNNFTFELDNALKSINSDYEAKRHKNIALRMPIVIALKKGTFNQWLRSKGKLGGQHKVPRLSNERILLEEIKKILLP